MKFSHLSLGIFVCIIAPSAVAELPKHGLMVDLDANKGVKADATGAVESWENQVKTNTQTKAGRAAIFAINDKGGRAKRKGSGKPKLLKSVKELNGNASLSFKNDELINDEEDTFDHLLTGSGYTWFVVLKPYVSDLSKTELGQKPLKNVNAFIGNLKNGAKYCGFWGALDDDLTVWCGPRNDLSFGRFDQNNPKLTGPKLEANKFYIIGSRMEAGKVGKVKCDLFVNESKSVAHATFPVNPKANASKLAIGTERDAVEHPGVESFDGEIARVLIYERPLSAKEMRETFESLRTKYFLNKGVPTDSKNK